MEKTAPHTPEFNEVVECEIGLLKDMCQLMIQAANLSEYLKKVLWTMAVRCVNTVYILTVTEEDHKSPFERFTR